MLQGSWQIKEQSGGKQSRTGYVKYIHDTEHITRSLLIYCSWSTQERVNVAQNTADESKSRANRSSSHPVRSGPFPSLRQHAKHETIRGLILIAGVSSPLPATLRTRCLQQSHTRSLRRAMEPTANPFNTFVANAITSKRTSHILPHRKVRKYSYRC